MREEFTATLPPEFIKNPTDRCGPIGNDWLDGLPRLIEELEKKWQIVVGRHFKNLSYNYVANAAFISGKAVVLKVASPFNMPAIASEASYLRTLGWARGR